MTGSDVPATVHLAINLVLNVPAAANPARHPARYLHQGDTVHLSHDRSPARHPARDPTTGTPM